MNLCRNHDHTTRDNPQTLLWERFHVGTVFWYRVKVCSANCLSTGANPASLHMQHVHYVMALLKSQVPLKLSAAAAFGHLDKLCMSFVVLLIYFKFF